MPSGRVVIFSHLLTLYFCVDTTNENCHKFAVFCVLYTAARSAVFRAMFEHDTEERRQVRMTVCVYIPQTRRLLCLHKSLCEHSV